MLARWKLAGEKVETLLRWWLAFQVLALGNVALLLLQRCRWREKMKNGGELPWLLVWEEED